jgi:AraC-like DNA-binding protein
MPISSVRSFSDPDEYSESFRDFDYDFAVTSGRAFAAEHVRVDLHKVLLQKYVSNLPWVAHTGIRKGRAVFAFRAGPGPALLRAGVEMRTTNLERLAENQTIFTRSSGPVLWGTISLPVKALSAIGAATAGCDLTPPADVVTQTPPLAVMSRLQRLYAKAMLLAKEVPEIIANAEAARALEHELVETLVACLRPAKDEEDAVAKRSHALVMRRFRAILEESGDRPVCVADLCSAIGVSDRTLLTCCREHLGMGPQKYLWSRRMQRVRRDLTRADHLSATVSKIATAHGFWELGRFAAAYRLTYGENPSTTLARRKIMDK